MNASDQTYKNVEETAIPENEDQDTIVSNGSVDEVSSSVIKERKRHTRVQRKKVFINGERKYSCESCGQLFNYSGNLDKHARTHSGEKPYQCKYCYKRFNSPYSLNIQGV